MTTHQQENGFILLEAIIAVSVLVTIFAATIALYVSSVGGLRISHDQLIATYLAQDGMEQVIAKRQYNYDKGEPWLDGLSLCTTLAPCSIDYFTDTLDLPLVACGGDDCLLYLDANGQYSTDSLGTPSYFKRKVELHDVSTFEKRAVVRVSWTDGADVLEVPVSYILYDEPSL